MAKKSDGLGSTIGTLAGVAALVGGGIWLWKKYGEDGNGNGEPEPPPVGKANLYGFVKDKSTGKGISNATVELVTRNTKTASNGYYSFLDLDLGHWTVMVFADGYDDEVFDVNLIEGNNRFDIELESEYQEPPAFEGCSLRIIKALSQSNTVGEAAKLLGCSRPAIYKWLKPHGLNPFDLLTNEKSYPIKKMSKASFSREYAAWREAVLRRDNHKCQNCGKGLKDNISLETHHKKFVCNNPDLIFNVDNGITLCRQCHIALHSKARRKSS